MPASDHPRTNSTGYEHFLVGAGAHASVDLSGKTLVLDTNTLLDLYSMHDKALDEVFDGLRRVKQQLFMPAQVQHEF